MCLQPPRFFKFLPELQREIILWLKDEPDAHRYALVAKRFHVWLQPFLYRSVRLRNNDIAKAFVRYQLASAPANVHELHLGPSVNVVAASDIFSLCPKIESLTIYFSHGQIEDEEANALLEPLASLRSLRALYIGLANAGDLRGVFYLPSYPVFNRLTHLHLAATAIVLSTIPLGISRLSNLTHLSLHWYTASSCTAGLQGFLARCSSRVLILWHSDSSSYDALKDNLERRNLADPQVVLFRRCQYSEYMAGGGFWSYAEQVIIWRIRTKETALAVNTEIERP